MNAVKQYVLQAFLVFVMVALLLIGVTLVNRVDRVYEELELGFLILQQAESTEELNGETIAAMATQVAQTEERALDYLGIFESIGFAITILGIVGTVLGAVLGTSVNNAREEFQKAQKSLEDLEKRNKELSDELDRKVTETTQKSNIAQFYVVLARTQAELGDLTGAIDTYERAKALIPNNPVPFYHIGYILTQLNRFDEAEIILKEALNRDSSFANAKAALGFVYRRRWDKLDKDIQDGKVVAGPEADERLHHYAKVAKDLIGEALQAEPSLVDDNGESWHGSLGGLYRRQKDLRKAAYHYHEATMITRQSSYPLLNLAMIEWEQGHLENIIPQLERAAELVQRKIKKDKDTYWDNADLMNVQLALGENEAALNTLKAFFQVMPPEAKDVLERVISSTEFIRNAPMPDPDNRDPATIDEVLRQLRAAAGIGDKNGTEA